MASHDALAAGIIDHYERHARAWDADRRNSAWTDRGWHHRFVAELPAGARVLDLGCGSGVPVARHMAAHGLGVTGVDSSPTMIAMSRERLPGEEWIVADMRALGLGRRFDGILAWDSFFHLTPDDQRRMFAVFAAHAASPAFLMFNAGPAGPGRGDRRLSRRPALSRELGCRRLRGTARRPRVRHPRARDRGSRDGRRPHRVAGTRGRLSSRSSCANGRYPEKSTGGAIS